MLFYTYFFVSLPIFEILEIMKAKKVLFITQEIIPYVPKNNVSVLGQKLPSTIQSKGREIRTFMPKWGNINERRNQLHEVIRLSGMNIIIDETDHPLIIKVASIQPVHMQVYFIDNDEYFQKGTEDTEDMEEDGERTIFYGRGVLETVKKLRWNPDVIHCHGWISALVPLFLRTMFSDEPAFKESKIIYSGYKNSPSVNLGPEFGKLLQFRNIPEDVLKDYPGDFNFTEMQKLAIDYADGFVEGEEGVDPQFAAYAEEKGKKVLRFPGEDNYEAYGSFYDEVTEA